MFAAVSVSDSSGLWKRAEVLHWALRIRCEVIAHDITEIHTQQRLIGHMQLSGEAARIE